MAKKIIALIAAVMVTASAYSQGTVTFITRTLGTSAQVLDWNGVAVGNPAADPLVSNGQNVLAQLYAAAGQNAAEASLVAVGSPVNIRNNANAGYVQESGTAVQGVGGPAIGAVNNVVSVTTTAGGPATVQLRAWLASYGLTYGNGWAANHNLPGAGGSALLNLASTGGGGSPPGLPVPLTGLTGFRLNPIPEPSTILLGLIGAAALLLRRRS